MLSNLADVNFAVERSGPGTADADLQFLEMETRAVLTWRGGCKNRRCRHMAYRRGTQWPGNGTR